MPKDTNGRPDSNFTITLDELLTDLASTANSAQQVSEANGDHRSNIKAIIDNRGYHKKAFADFRAIYGMSDSKFADYWRTFKPMLDAYAEEAERRIADMIDAADAEASEMEGDLG